MFLVADRHQPVDRALQHLRSQITAHVESGPVRRESIAGRTLGWFTCRPTDNVHRFQDGFLIGALSYAEPIHAEVQHHAAPMPAALNHVWGGVKISDTGLVEPLGTLNVYHSASSVSDMQLLIADLEGHQPGPLGFALLSQIGYLPGNLTLFERIRRIPFRATLDMRTWSIRSTPSIDLPAPDDDAMVSRLVEIVPRVDDSFVAISGGTDSRFVLGCVQRAGIRPRLLHSGNAEYRFAQSIASTLDLELLHSEDQPLAQAPPVKQIDPFLYTLMSDAQIIFASGALSKWRRYFTPSTILHVGAYSTSMLKNAFTTARWIPAVHQGCHEHLIQRALLSSTPEKVPLLKHWNRRAELLRLLADELAYQSAHVRTRSMKAIANWFYYMNRGLRWAAAVTAEASFFARPTFILSDHEATLLGLATTETVNRANARLRSLNRRLLPHLDTPYASGLPVTPAESWKRIPERLAYEYRIRAWAHRQARVSARVSPPPTPGTAVMMSDALCAFTTRGPDVILKDPSAPRRLKRALVTLSHPLKYLGQPA